MSYTVGQVVGILRHGSWGITTQGKYTVTKINTVRIELVRIGDGHIRTFSVKTGKELGICSHNAVIVSEDLYDKHVAIKSAEDARAKSIADIKAYADKLHHRAVGPDDIAIMRALLDEAEKFVIAA